MPAQNWYRKATAWLHLDKDLSWPGPPFTSPSLHQREDTATGGVSIEGTKSTKSTQRSSRLGRYPVKW